QRGRDSLPQVVAWTIGDCVKTAEAGHVLVAFDFARHAQADTMICAALARILHSYRVIMTQADTPFRTFMCVVCGFLYSEAEGWPDDGIEAGTRWEDVPETWTCPDCGVTKSDFEMIEL